MGLKLESHFVAFIDILGFSEMVRHDCESSNSPKYLDILHKSHVQATEILGEDLQTGLIQFSDSIVFSRAFDLAALDGFISSVANLQKSMFKNGLLCRGGITFGKHFVKDRFMFSKGMIDAYHLESLKAKFPRVIISENLLELAEPKINLSSLKLLRADDGLTFVDYLSPDSEDEQSDLILSVNKFISNLDS